MSNCVAELLEVALKAPNRVAIRESLTHAVTFSTFHARLTAAAKRLGDHGIAPGDVVLLMAPSSADIYAVMTGILAQGARVLFIEPWMPLAQVSEIVSTLRPKAFVFGGKARLWSAVHKNVWAIPIHLSVQQLVSGAPLEWLAPSECASVPSTQPASIVFSSGTVGHAKGILRTHENVLRIVETALRHAESPELASQPDLGLFSGMTFLHLYSGRGSILVPRAWNTSSHCESFFRGLETLPKEHQPISLTASPAFLSYLLERKLLPQLASVHVGGAVLDVKVAKQALSHWKSAHLVHVYGCSEAEPIALASLEEAVAHADTTGDVQLHFIGRPIPELNWEIDTHGLWVSGPNVTTGYVALREREVAHKRRNSNGDMFHLTNDRVVQTSDGWCLHGRATQDLASFEAQRKVQRILGHSDVFVHRLPSGARLAVGRGVNSVANVLREKELVDDVYETKIVRDRRHGSRIDFQRTLKNGSLLRRVYAFSHERAPLIGLAMVCGGPVAAATHFATPQGIFGASEIGSLPFFRATAALVAMMTLFFLVRLTDELKDYDKDCRERPSRPLPRGLLTLPEVRRVRIFLVGTLLAASGLLYSTAPLFGLTVLASLGGLTLLAEDFFSPRGFETHPLRHAVVHQTAVVPFYALPFSLFPSTDLTRVAAYVMTCVASSLCFEFARKLDPKLPPETRTYERVVGFPRARWALVGAFALLGVTLFTLTGRWWVGALALVAAASSVFLPQRGRRLFSAATQLSVVAALWSFFLA